MFSLWSLFKAGLLITNAVAILHKVNELSQHLFAACRNALQVVHNRSLINHVYTSFASCLQQTRFLRPLGWSEPELSLGNANLKNQGMACLLELLQSCLQRNIFTAISDNRALFRHC
jgi:Yos1-like